MNPDTRCAGLVVAAISAGLAAGQVSAAGTIVSPTAVLGTDLGTFNDDVPLVNMINQSGLDKPFESGVTDFDAYFETPPEPFAQANYRNNWQSEVVFDLPVTGYVDFDLGQTYAIDRLAIWSISLENITVLLSETEGGPMQDAGDYTLENKLFNPFSYRGQVLDLGATYEARYLRLGIESTYKFSPSDTFAYAIVGEVAVGTAGEGGPTLAADFDEDGDVDAFDLGIWQTAFGNSDGGDADDDGDTDAFDLGIWQTQFGMTSSGVAVPEPTSGVLLLSLAAMLAVRARGVIASTS